MRALINPAEVLEREGTASLSSHRATRAREEQRNVSRMREGCLVRLAPEKSLERTFHTGGERLIATVEEEFVLVLLPARWRQEIVRLRPV